MKKLWIVIPAFNEGPAIGEVVAGVRAQYTNVVVVDDCSRDDTGEKAKAAGAVVLRHPVNLGQGAALQTGIDFALANGAGYVVTFDADGQHCVEDIASLVATADSSGCDCVLGSRFLGSAQNMPPARRLLLQLAVLFTRVTSGLKLTDAHNGLRLLTRDAARRIRLRQNRMAHASEIIEQIAALRLTHREVPVRVVYTEYSIAKGQRSSAALRILADFVVARLSK